MSVRRRLGADRGSAVVGFTLVAPLVLVLLLGALQVMFAALLRGNLTGIALESARAAAALDGSIDAGHNHADHLIRGVRAGGHVDTIDIEYVTVQAIPSVRVTITATPALVGPIPTPRMNVVVTVVRETL